MIGGEPLFFGPRGDFSIAGHQDASSEIPDENALRHRKHTGDSKAQDIGETAIRRPRKLLAGQLRYLASLQWHPPDDQREVPLVVPFVDRIASPKQDQVRLLPAAIDAGPDQLRSARGLARKLDLLLLKAVPRIGFAIGNVRIVRARFDDLRQVISELLQILAIRNGPGITSSFGVSSEFAKRRDDASDCDAQPANREVIPGLFLKAVSVGCRIWTFAGRSIAGHLQTGLPHQRGAGVFDPLPGGRIGMCRAGSGDRGDHYPADGFDPVEFADGGTATHGTTRAGGGVAGCGEIFGSLTQEMNWQRYRPRRLEPRW